MGTYGSDGAGVDAGPVSVMSRISALAKAEMLASSSAGAGPSGVAGTSSSAGEVVGAGASATVGTSGSAGGVAGTALSDLLVVELGSVFGGVSDAPVPAVSCPASTPLGTGLGGGSDSKTHSDIIPNPSRRLESIVTMAMYRFGVMSKVVSWCGLTWWRIFYDKIPWRGLERR